MMVIALHMTRIENGLITDLKNARKHNIKLIQNYVVGTFNRQGTCTVLRFFQVNQKNPLNFENYDLLCLKIIKRHNDSVPILFSLNEYFLSYTKIKNLQRLQEVLSCKDFNLFDKLDYDSLLRSASYQSCFKKAAIDKYGKPYLLYIKLYPIDNIEKKSSQLFHSHVINSKLLSFNHSQLF